MGSRRSDWTAWVAGCILGLSLGAESWGQELPQTPEDALHQMAQLAGVIFTGQVVAVRRSGGTGSDGHVAAGPGAGVMEVEFAVEDAVRGVSAGRYTLREWAGLWAGDDEPFRVGQRYLMLLHSPGAAGLSSPVGGMDGAIPIRGEEAAVGPSVETARRARPRDAASGDGSRASLSGPVSGDGRVIDLSWVGTRVVRPVAYVPAPGRGARPIMAQAELAGGAPLTVGKSAGGIGLSGTAQGKQQATAGAAVAYSTVLGMLRSWEKSDHGER